MGSFQWTFVEYKEQNGFVFVIFSGLDRVQRRLWMWASCRGPAHVIMSAMVTRLLLLIAPLACFGASILPPDADQRLAHDIYKEIVEIKSGFTTGATTPVVEAIAKRLRAAGFSDSDIFIGGAIPRKANLVVRYRGAGKLKPILLLA